MLYPSKNSCVYRYRRMILEQKHLIFFLYLMLQVVYDKNNIPSQSLRNIWLFIWQANLLKRKDIKVWDIVNQSVLTMISLSAN